MSLNFCPQCGNQWIKDAKFCSKCGYKHASQEIVIESKNKAQTHLTQQTPAYKMNLHQKILIGILGTVSIILLFVFTQKTIVKKENNTLNTPKKEQLDELSQQFESITLDHKTELLNAKSWEDSLKALTQIIQEAETQNRFEWAGYYRELIANKEKTEIKYLDAASRYFEATKVVSDTSLKRKIAIRAISLYDKVLKINPKNISASVDMAVCYTLTGNPMQGIFMLRDVADKNPTHVLAQHNLGILSMQTGQYEKAVKRFEKVLSLNPDNTIVKDQALLYAGIAYMEMKKKSEAKIKFSQLVNTTQNPNYQAEAKKYLSLLEK